MPCQRGLSCRFFGHGALLLDHAQLAQAERAPRCNIDSWRSLELLCVVWDVLVILASFNTRGVFFHNIGWSLKVLLL